MLLSIQFPHQINPKLHKGHEQPPIVVRLPADISTILNAVITAFFVYRSHALQISAGAYTVIDIASCNIMVTEFDTKEIVPKKI